MILASCLCSVCMYHASDVAVELDVTDAALFVASSCLSNLSKSFLWKRIMPSYNAMIVNKL